MLNVTPVSDSPLSFVPPTGCAVAVALCASQAGDAMSSLYGAEETDLLRNLSEHFKRHLSSPARDEKQWNSEMLRDIWSGAPGSPPELFTCFGSRVLRGGVSHIISEKFKTTISISHCPSGAVKGVCSHSCRHPSPNPLSTDTVVLVSTCNIF